jgi:hypothetical protein
LTRTPAKKPAQTAKIGVAKLERGCCKPGAFLGIVRLALAQPTYHFDDIPALISLSLKSGRAAQIRPFPPVFLAVPFRL